MASSNSDIMRKNYDAFLRSENGKGKQIGEMEKSVENHAVPRFSIFLPFSTEKVPTLKSCFIKRLSILRKDIPFHILADDGFIYNAVYDCQIPLTNEPINFIVSFQTHSYGRFAIFRLLTDKKSKVKSFRKF